MSPLLLLAVLAVGTYQPHDFHYYDDNLQSRGLNMTPKVYVDISSSDEKKKFLEAIDKAEGLERFKDIDVDRLNGLLLFFKTKENALELLNKQADNYPVYPIFLYEGIEVAAINEIILQVQPNVSEEDLLKRLRDETKADYLIIGRQDAGVYILKVTNLKYPSNILVLANLVARDSFWFKAAMVYWSPLEGFIKATLAVETEAHTHLGELRKIKLTIDVLDPAIKVRKDLLPQLGQTLVPFPNAGEIWFDAFPQEITESEEGRKKTITVVQPFRQLQFGNFIFQPVVVSYERLNKLRTVNSNVCEFGIRSVIEGTNIEDIQPRDMDLSLNAVRPSKSAWFLESDDIFLSTLTYPVVFFLGSLAALFFSWAFVDFAGRLQKKKPDPRANLWAELEAISFSLAADTTENWKSNYLVISHKLNEVLTSCFGVSLYTVNLNRCNENFRRVIGELNKVYREQDMPDTLTIIEGLRTFCLYRRYD